MVGISRIRTIVINIILTNQRATFRRSGSTVGDGIASLPR